jgi:signal transduction histidine kinase
MTRLRAWPRSLFGRIVLILFLGLGAAHALSFWLLVAERGMAMRDLVLSNLTRDVASAAALLERVPPAERAAWLVRLDRRNYRFGLQAPLVAQAQHAPSAEAQAIAHAVGQALFPARTVRVAAPPDARVVLRLQVPLADGASLSVDVAAPRWSVSPWAVAALALQLALLAALCGWAVRQATRPLQALAEAADALGPAQAQAPMPLDGPREVARAASAFNRMQARIHAHLDERMRILAAVSHDLQTPITRLRLRAELLDDAVLRDKLQADLAEMQDLVEEGISYARSAQAVREPERLVDLRALLASIVGDYGDAGRPVVLHAGAPLSAQTRPQALRRLICNLVDNALKFAGTAEVAIERMPGGALQLQVMDRGPGIPASELQAVLQPYVRLEDSRSRGTGGTGLGLAIADQLAQALGGTLVLAARTGGGLAAEVVLPAGVALVLPAH